MDFEMFESDLTVALGRIPRDFVETVARALVKHKDKLIQAFPMLASSLWPHIRTVGMEMATGILDKDELEKTLVNVMKKAGVTFPSEAVALNGSLSSTEVTVPNAPNPLTSSSR